jgi:hypothetical protein
MTACFFDEQDFKVFDGRFDFQLDLSQSLDLYRTDKRGVRARSMLKKRKENPSSAYISYMHF